MANQTDILIGGNRGRIGLLRTRRYAPIDDTPFFEAPKKRTIRRAIVRIFTIMATRHPAGPEDATADYLQERAHMMRFTGLVD